jgi:hypothetical protein
MSIQTPTQRRCFTHGCPGTPTGSHWECPACKRRIHLASEAATARAARRRKARELADTLPHTKVAADLLPVSTHECYKPGNTFWGGQVSPTAVVTPSDEGQP